MKNLIFIISLILVVTATSCDDRQKSLAGDIAAQLSESIAEINDSTFKNVVITSIDGADASEISVNGTDVTSDPKGNLYVNVSVEADSDNEEIWIVILPFVATMLAFLSPLAFIFIVCYFIHKSKRDRNMVIVDAMAKGYTLPDSFYNKPERRPHLQPAVNYLAWSTGFFAFFAISDYMKAAMLALIPFIIGIGKLATYLMAVRKEKNEKTDTPDLRDNVE